MSTEKPKSSFGEWLRFAREARSLALREVASRTGLDSSLISRFENGERLPTEKQADSLAEFFRADPEQAHALRIAAQFRRKFARHPAARTAILRLAEEEGVYQAKKKGPR